MAENTGIAWARSTFNPWIGCTRVSPACQHCYAEAFNKRVGGDNWGPKASRRRTSAHNWNEPRRWDRKAVPGQPWRVFCASMADVFDDHPSVLPEWRAALWQLIRETPHLTWMLLTKRPQNVQAMLPDDLKAMPRVWPGTTCEDQEWADERLPHLRDLDCAGIRWVSAEPLLGPIDFTPYLADTRKGIGWIITGEESGHGRRPINRDHVRAIRDQCATHGAAFFHKQEIINGKKVELPSLDGRTHDAFPHA